MSDEENMMHYEEITIKVDTHPQTIWFSMTNRHGDSITIDGKDIRWWLMMRHPFLWMRNKDMRNWFKGWES